MTPQEIIAQVADERHLSVTDIIGECRRNELVNARIIAAVRMANNLKMTYKDIAPYLRRDRTTVLYYLKVAQWRDL